MFIMTVLLVVYILAVNFYAFLMMKDIKDEQVTPVTLYDRKLALTAVLGGAITIYVCMFVFKYRRNSLFLMILMPVLGALNLWLWFVAIRSGFTLFRPWQGNKILLFLLYHIRKKYVNILWKLSLAFYKSYFFTFFRIFSQASQKEKFVYFFVKKGQKVFDNSFQ